jgi:predicted ribosome quality control (RQC) complex YloA/Tae2 family protein
MPMDAVCLRAATRELQTLVGARVEKIQQPMRDSVVLLLPRSQRLLINAGANQPRIQLTGTLRENPAQPPMFCMLLRKHLSGARIISITQPESERLVRIDFEVLDEMGETGRRSLVLEAIGRRANLVLLDGTERIVDCLRRVDMDMSEERQVMPGMFYRLPPAQEGKVSPLSLGRDEFSSMLSSADGEKTVSDFLLASLNGMSPLLCRELSFRACGSTDARVFELGENGKAALENAFVSFVQDVKEGRFKPEMLVKNGKPYDFTVIDIEQYCGAMERVKFETVSEMLDAFFETREKAERMRSLGQELNKTASGARDRTRRKLALQEKEYAATQERETLRKCGDLITANLYRMEKGASSLEAEDFYEEGCPRIRIKLDPLLTPQQNAARYYKNYNKAKTAEKMLSEQMEKGRAELYYLESVLEELSEAETEQDLRDIRGELQNAGYLRAPERKQMKRASSGPREFVSGAGFRISVGRNNVQNDALTLRESSKGDIWFHTQKIHGSHVILRTGGAEPDERSLTEAASLAAYYSKARGGQNVPVDYTRVKNVKKPSGARPGMVIYENFRTAYVTPDEDMVKRLSK